MGLVTLVAGIDVYFVWRENCAWVLKKTTSVACILKGDNVARWKMDNACVEVHELCRRWILGEIIVDGGVAKLMRIHVFVMKGSGGDSDEHVYNLQEHLAFQVRYFITCDSHGSDCRHEVLVGDFDFGWSKHIWVIQPGLPPVCVYQLIICYPSATPRDRTVGRVNASAD